MQFKKRGVVPHSNRGQALLIVVLVMVLVLTIGLSIASQTITSVRVTTDEEKSQRAFFAAETGIERALKQNNSISTTTLTGANSQYSATLNQVSGACFIVNCGDCSKTNCPVVQKDDGADIWLSNYAPDSSIYTTNQYNGSLTIYWGDPSLTANDTSSDCETVSVNPAMEIILLYGNKTSPTVVKNFYDPCQSRQAINGAVAAAANNSPGPCSPSSYAYHASSTDIVATITNGLMARIVPLYGNTRVCVTGTAALPLQGTAITSTGQASDSIRKISVFQGYPKLPTELFQYSAFQTHP